MVLLLSEGGLAESVPITEPFPVVFETSPSYAIVYVAEGGSKDPYECNKRVVLELSQNAHTDTQVRLQYIVPRWGLDEEKASNEARVVTVKAGDLRKGTYPLDGAYSVPLSTVDSIIAFASNRPVKFLLFLLIPVGGLVLLAHNRGRLAQMLNLGEQIKQVVTGYTLERLLGQGGMGEVWKAISDTGFDCAIKFLHKELGEDPDYKKRFEREFTACVELQHPHLLELIEHNYATDGRLYIVSEFLEGKTLKEVIREGEQAPPKLAHKVLLEIGAALQYLHQQGLVHRDVKPDNIFCCSNGDLKLLDLGLIQGDGLTALTQTGQVLGTPMYLAPEQMRGKPGAGSDQYALGVILYEILCGQRPFTQPNRQILAYQHQSVPPPPPTEIEPKLSAEIGDGLLKMLEKQPDTRFEDLSKAQEAMLDFLATLPWEEPDETIDADISTFTPPV